MARLFAVLLLLAAGAFEYHDAETNVDLLMRKKSLC